MTWQPISEWTEGMGPCIFARMASWDDVEYSLYDVDSATYFSELISPFTAGFDVPAKPLTIFEAAERLGEPLGLTGPEFLAKAEIVNSDREIGEINDTE